jgi:hypothetical protein
MRARIAERSIAEAARPGLPAAGHPVHDEHDDHDEHVVVLS